MTARTVLCTLFALILINAAMMLVGVFAGHTGLFQAAVEIAKPLWGAAVGAVASNLGKLAPPH